MTEAHDRWRAAMTRAFAAAPSLIFVVSSRGKLIIAAGRFRELGKPAVNDNACFAEAEPMFSQGDQRP
ncbi:hypothetical protein ABIB86_000386 [Bradyrhizobium sp. JR1.7]|uniref:hypothetical protein n=1 Tax=unclassified Bradyrhizobium TaxID=2631580 RepID=UPI003399E3EF